MKLSERGGFGQPLRKCPFWFYKNTEKQKKKKNILSMTHFKDSTPFCSVTCADTIYYFFHSTTSFKEVKIGINNVFQSTSFIKHIQK